MSLDFNSFLSYAIIVNRLLNLETNVMNKENDIMTLIFKTNTVTCKPLIQVITTVRELTLKKKQHGRTIER